MLFLSPADRVFAQAVAQMAFNNSFLHEQIEREREALGDDFLNVELFWSKRGDLVGEHPNIVKIMNRAEQLAARLRTSLEKNRRQDPKDLELYEDIVIYILY